MDVTACNYDSAATFDDGTNCIFEVEFLDCEGNCLNDLDGDGICDELEVAGCPDVEACNYDETLIETDNSLCVYADTYYDCDGNCLNDSDGDGICDELEVPGCTDMGACNYDETATEDDGSCGVLDVCGVCLGDDSSCSGCTIAFACNYDATATVGDNDTCEYETCAGCMDGTACNYDDTATFDDGTNCINAVQYYDCDGNCLNDSDGDGICEELEVSGCTDMGACNYDDTATEDDGSCALDDECGVCGGDNSTCSGCTITLACNYDATATVDDNDTCEYETCAGCMEPLACNYDETATFDPGTICFYPLQYYDCDGNCLNDSDGDGICDELEVVGCTDVDACNYDSLATQDDGSCDYCSCPPTPDSYTLTVEANTPASASGTTYRFYVNMIDATDRMSAIFAS